MNSKKCKFYYLMSFVLTLTMCSACVGKQKKKVDDSTKATIAIAGLEKDTNSFIPGNTVKTRYELPKGYHRVKTEKGSFEEFLQNLPLKPVGYPTHLYDGRLKDRKVSTSVIALDVDSVNLQHGADAIIRLWAEYLYNARQYDKIHFVFKDSFQCDYTKWAQGFRVVSDGNGTRWYKADTPIEDYSYLTFREYLRTVLAHIDDKTLLKEMKDAKEDEFGIGTVICSGREPMHIAIVVDMLEKDTIRPHHKVDNLEVALLAQGGNPSQEIEIVKGNGDEFNLFKEGDKDVTKRKHSFIWTTPNKGERKLSKQGGGLFTGEHDFVDKKLKIFKFN